MSNFLKGSLLASLFLLTCTFSMQSSAQLNLKSIAIDPQWQALLHIYKDNTFIKGNFLLSGSSFSAKNELIQTIALFDARDQDPLACHFIARHYYLTAIKGLKLPNIQCPDFNNFKLKAPVDHISILFASENLSQPASIMGHTMMALSDANFTTQHSVSFFTELNTVNPVKLIWDNLIVGQPGYFLVQPLQQSIDLYLNQEQRNIWRYPVKVSEQERALLLRHLWELKFVSMDYLFNAHNCATLTLDILRIINPKIIIDRQDWVSPIDVIKAANNQKMLAAPMLYGSSKWKIRILSEYTDTISPSISITQDKPSTVLAGLLSFETNRYRYHQGHIPRTDWYRHNSQLREQGLNKNEHSFSLDRFQNPLLTPKDSQWGGSIYQSRFSTENQTWRSIYWMPASHQIMDDNQQYSSENALEILMLKLRMNSSEVQLESLRLYQVESYLNNNRYIGGTSGRFGIGLNRYPINNSQDALAGYIEGALGKTYQIHKDLSFYVFWQVGAVVNPDSQFIVNGPELGLFFYWIGGMKTHVKANKLWRYGQYPLQEVSLKHSLYSWNSGNLKLHFDHTKWDNQNQYKGEIGVSFYY
jgi:hypothetical protein